MKLELIRHFEILEKAPFGSSHEHIAAVARELQRDYDLEQIKPVVDELEAKVKALEAKLPLLLTPGEASFLTVCFDIASSARYGGIALDAPIRAKLRAIVEGA
jgi:hypothetical protein